MEFGHELKRFCTAEEASLIAVGLPIPNHLMSSSVTRSEVADDSQQSNSNLEKIGQAAIIKEAIIIEVGLAYHAINGSAKVVMPTTVIEIAQPSYYHDGGISREPLPESTLITKTSIAKFFYDAGDFDLAKLFDRKESYRSSKKLDEFLANENIPEGLRVAILVYKECWENLPFGMNSPTKAQLVEFIKAEGVTKEVDIEAIIRNSKPDDFEFKGGVPKPDSLKWAPLKER
jgi:hypothetical protein